MHPHIDAGIEKALKLRYFRNKTPLGDPPEQVELVGKWFNLTRVNMEIGDSRFVPLDDFRKKVFDEVLEFSRRYQCYIPWYTYKLSIDPGKRWSRVEIEMHVYDELVIVDESEGIYIRDED